MSEQEHRAAFESLAAYALGALPESEHRAVAEHIEGCPICAEDAAGLQRAAAGLLESVPLLDPPPDLRDRIMAVVESEAKLLRAAGAPPAPAPAAPRIARLTGSWSGPLRLRLAAGAAALLLIGGVVGAVSQGGDGARTRTLSAQAGTSADRAWLEVRGGDAELVVRGLAAPRPQRVYEVWVQHGADAPKPAGALFVVRSGRIGIPARLQSGDRVMVSEEPAGGSPAPTTPPVVVTARV